jgi:ribose transport system ATP-binding protein
MISSELPEILRMSNRIVVMCEGRITGELAAEQATQEQIMELATRRDTARAA